MAFLQTSPDPIDKLWKGVKPLLQTRAATMAINVARRNPKTAIALAVASGLGVLIAAVAKKRGSGKIEPRKMLPSRRNRTLPGYVANPVATNGSPAMTQ